MLSGLHIGRARAQGFGHDRLRAQLAVHRLAAEIDADRMLGPAAILVVRHARLRLPPRREIGAATAFEDSLHPLITGASRAAAGFVPAGAQAILFADEAELLACLARALIDGSLAGQWWWAALRIGAPRDRAVAQAWLDRSQAIAVALETLDRSGQAAAFVRAVGPLAAAELARGLIATHDLWRLAGLPQAASETPPPAAPRDPAPRQHGDEPEPWAHLALHGTTRSLPAALQWPVVLAATLRRAPTRARSEAFSAEARDWLAAQSDSDEQSPDNPSAVPTMIERSRKRSAGNKAPTRRHPAPPAQNAPVFANETAGAPPVSLPSSPSAPLTPAAAATTRGMMTDESEVPLIEAAKAALPPVEPDPVREVRTAFGGLLFLLNVALALELWGDFTRPRHDDLPVSPWTWLGVVGARLCGAEFAGDPLCALLRELAADDPLADAPHDWPIPAAFQAGRSRDPFAAHLSYLRARLLAAFGVSRFATVRRCLLHRPARIQAGAVRLDATFAIADHPVQIRAAGLDRDPGWIPAAGRDVRFHFR